MGFIQSAQSPLYPQGSEPAHRQRILGRESARVSRKSKKAKAPKAVLGAKNNTVQPPNKIAGRMA